MKIFRYFFIGFIFLSFTQIGLAQETKLVQTETIPDIILPNITPAPVPPSPVRPDSVINLNENVLFVVQTNIPALVLCSPDQVVKITEEVGPISIHAKFIDSNNKTITKKFTSKSVFIIEADKQGLCEILIIPLTKPKELIRRTINSLGTPVPIPPDPIPIPIDQDVLRFQTAIKNDLQSNLGTRSDAAKLAESYRTAITALLPNCKTLFEIQIQMSQKLTQVIGEPTKVLPHLRKEIANSFASKWGANPSGAWDLEAMKIFFQTIGTKVDQANQ